MSYSDFLLAEKQIERFGPNQFSHFLLAEKQIERYMPKVAGHCRPTAFRTLVWKG